MKITATITNAPGDHQLSVSTAGSEKHLKVPGRPSGGSAVNGGELLFAALATCFCNDIYREAMKRGITLSAVNVHVEGEFGAEGEPARNVTYRASVEGDAPATELRALISETDRVAEVQNTLRSGVDVKLRVE